MTQKLARLVTDYDNPDSFGSRLRAKRVAPLLRMIEDVYARRGTATIIDVGGTPTYWKIVPEDFLEAHNVHITLVNLPGTGLSAEDQRFEVVEADGCDLGVFGDRAFDIAHSNSVIEHVGDQLRMIAFCKEITRVASAYFVQTPSYWFPVEPHAMTPFFHWLPKPARIWWVMRASLGHWTRAATRDEALALVESARLLRLRDLKSLLPYADISTERFLGLPKSYVAVGPLESHQTDRSN